MSPDLKSRLHLEDVIPLASGVAVFSKVQQTYCDIPIIDSSNNLICLYHILPKMTNIWFSNLILVAFRNAISTSNCGEFDNTDVTTKVSQWCRRMVNKRYLQHEILFPAGTIAFNSNSCGFHILKLESHIRVKLV